LIVIRLRRSLLIIHDSVLVYPGLRAATANEPIPIYAIADQVSGDIVCREDKLVVMYRDYRHLSLWTSRIGPDTRATKIEIGPLQPPYALVSIHPRQDMFLVVSSTRKNKDDDREGGLFISKWTFNGDCVSERTIRIDPFGYPGNKAVAFSIQSCYPSCVQEVLAFAVRNLNAPKGKRRAVGLVTLEWQQQKFCSTILPIHTQAFMSQFGRGDFEGKSVMYRPTGLLAVFDTNTSNGHVVLDTTIPAYIVPDFGEF
jgi:hypothetical protein